MTVLLVSQIVVGKLFFIQCIWFIIPLPLASIVSNEKWAVYLNLIVVLFHLISFFLLPLSKFSLWLSMVFIMMCTSVYLFVFSPLGVHCLGCNVMFVFKIKFGKLLVIISSDIFSTPSFLSLEIPLLVCWCIP